MSDTQQSKLLAAPKVGDLVKFVGHRTGPHGDVLSLNTVPREPHPSQPRRDVAYIEWACKYTAPGNYQLSFLEVVNDAS